MIPVDRISQVASAAALGGASLDPASVARQVMGTIGDRVAAWAGEIFGGGSQGGGGFTPNTAELARGGDVYELRSLVAETGAKFGAGPAAEGELLRATEDFTRAAAPHVYAGDRGVDTVRSAVDNASADGNGLDGVVGRLEAATRELRASSGT